MAEPAGGEMTRRILQIAMLAASVTFAPTYIVGAHAADNAGAPRVTITNSNPLRVPLPFPYNGRANAAQDVYAAFARARASGKRVVIDFGRNWCPDCRILAGVLERPEVEPFVEEHFELVTVDVARFDKNMDIPARYGAKVTGVPWLIIAEPDGTVVHSSYEITDNGFASKPQAMVDWLAKWAKSK